MHPLTCREDNLTRIPGSRVRRFFLERSGCSGTVHFMDGTPTAAVFDTERDHYLWLQVGWTERGRTYGTTVHVRLRGGKIVIEQDWTEDGIAIDLLRAGIPAEAIVLGFHEPAVGQELSGVILLGS